jgi:hypothetical protein
LLLEPAQRGNPGLVQPWRRRTDLPSRRTPGLLESRNGDAQRRKAPGQQLKISGAHPATSAMTEHQDGYWAISKIDKEPGLPLRRVHRNNHRYHDQISVS